MKPLSHIQQEQDVLFDKNWADTLTEKAADGILKFMHIRDLAIENAVRAELVEKIKPWEGKYGSEGYLSYKEVLALLTTSPSQS